MNYLLLALNAFIAATLLPASSEVALSLLAQTGDDSWTGLWLAATFGNVAGALLNWSLGRYLSHWQQHPYFPFKPQQWHTAQNWFQRYGAPTLLLSWLPIIGDPLTFVAGMAKMRCLPFLLWVSIAKGGRYALILWLLDF